MSTFRGRPTSAMSRDEFKAALSQLYKEMHGLSRDALASVEVRRRVDAAANELKGAIGTMLSEEKQMELDKLTARDA